MPRPASSTRPSKLPTEQVHPADRAAWRRWLAANHAVSSGIWLVFDKKGARSDRLAYGDAVEEALCFGWIDSVLRPIDDTRYMQLYTPRKRKSAWSKVNKDRVSRLLDQGLIAPAGLAAIDDARRTGSWSRLDAVESMVIPADLAKALAARPAAKKNFDGFAPSMRKAYLYWINGAKRPLTRAQRVREVVARAAANQKSRSRPAQTRHQGK